jgi:hypothetical protein
VTNHSDTPDVDRLAISFLLDDLWSHVKRTSKNLLQALLRVKLACETEVGQLNVGIVLVSSLLFWGNQDILWLDISMRDVLLVHVVDGE